MAASYELPKSVLLREDGPREGFQMHDKFVPTVDKLRLIEALSHTGITSIEITSFVRPDRVPQLRDAEEIAAQVQTVNGVRYRALYLNAKGLARALACPKIKPEGYILVAASDAFLTKNSNQTLEEALSSIPKWLSLFAQKKLPLERIMLSTAFGYGEDGRIEAEQIIQVCERIFRKLEAADGALQELTFADTTGYANPEAVKRLVGAFRERWPDVEVGLHFHDTRGTGIANVYAGLEMGVARFDCSVGGLGGCPFAKGAAGNVPTEDVAFLCEELGIKTGIDLEAYIDCARLAQALVGKPLPGKLKDAGII